MARLTSGIKLNKEQLDAIKYKKGPLLIVAGAGTGKTTVITERIKYLILSKKTKPEEVLALTFTEKAAREMEERVDVAMPYGYTQMWISTFHSFCDRVLRREALHIGLDPKYHLMSEAEAVQFIRNNLFAFDLNYFRPLGNPTKFIGGMLQHFSRLQDEDVSPQDYLAYAKKLKKVERLEKQKTIELAKAYKKYEELKVKEGLMDFGDLIVKTLLLFRKRPNVLRQYQDQFKYVLVDEFQDTNYAQNELAILLAGSAKNITVCGDDDQCLPGSTKVEIPNGSVAIKNIKVGDSVVTAVGKGYLSTSKVLDVSKKKKKARFLTFTTESGKRMTATDNHKMFCMIPGRKFGSRNTFYVYLMWREHLGWRLGITDDLPQRLKLERSADKILAIKACKSLEEAKFYEVIFSLKYQIPTYPFKPRKMMKITGEWLEKLFLEFDTNKNARRLAEDLHIDLNAHHYCLDGVVRGGKERIKILINMCSRRHRTKWARGRLMISPKVTHIVRIESSSDRIKKILTKEGIGPRKAKKGWRFQRGFSDIESAGKFARKLQDLTGGILEVRFDVGKKNEYSRSSLMMPAGNILPGMYIPLKNGHEVQYEAVTERNERVRTDYVYDLEVENTHNFIANGVVVHNSIYRFRGAAVSNMIQFRKSFPKSKIVVLTKNYRSTQEILDRAYELIQHNNPDRLEAVEKIDKRLISQVAKNGEAVTFIHADRVENEADAVAQKIKELKKEGDYEYKDFAVLVRANNHSEPFGRAFARHGIPYQFLGPGRLFKQPEVVDLISYLKVLYNLEDSVSFYRLLSMQYFDISARELVMIGNYARRLNLSFFESCEKIDDVFVREETRKKVKKILEIISRHLGLIRKETAGQLLYYFLSDTGLLTKMLSPETPEAEKRAANISKLFDKLKTYEVDHQDATVPAVVDWIELSSELGESPLAADADWVGVNAVNILTVHSAKGLEFRVVFLVNLVGQRFPTIERREQIPILDGLIKEILPVGDFHLEEERRLFYVGVTRAKDLLIFSAADYYGEGKREKRLSPFIFEALGDTAVSSERTDIEAQQLSFLDYRPTPLSEASYEIPKLHIDYLSYSQIETFKTCPLHYKLKYIYKVPTPPSGSQSFGSSMHAALKSFYERVARGERPDKKLTISCLKENWIREGFSSKAHETKFFEKGKFYLEGFLKDGFDPKVLPVAMEQPFTVPIEVGLKIGGKIDRVDVFKDGTIEIIDYKTGATVPSQKEVEKDLQLSFYALAATSIPTVPFGKKPDKVRLSLYFLDVQEKFTTTRTVEELEKAKKEIFKAKEEMEKSEFRCSGSILCQKCEYSLFCRTEQI